MRLEKWSYFFYGCLLSTGLLSCGDEENAPQEHPYFQLTQEERRTPQNALISFELTEGLQAKLFASEPMVTNPTSMDIDARGRIWICESYNYGISKEDQTEKGGRILILEDTDHDGKADKRTVFYQGENVHIALGIAVLGNKVYISRSPDILVFTDENGDDIPDSKEKLFTGMGRPGDHSTHAVIFGPDGKLYWNMGNSAGPVKAADGNQVIDQAGNEVIQYGPDYIGGMIFRCNPDGSGMETLAHNFRNNYEVTVDAYGNLWQSDNDDDGNKSCRVNYILEYGNYGYLDEMTRANWSTPRSNMEEEIPDRHWHQNDPGVVPNLLITGAGSPAGILFYEGDLLPRRFQNQMIHCDAGPNVVRAYLVQKEKAGYVATIANILKSKYDQWFRPVDVTAAPDGSIFVADWYDAGVGGGVAADAEKGRIFRIAPKNNVYTINTPEINNIESAIEGLKSPNYSLRYLAWSFLHEAGVRAEPGLNELFISDNPVYRARALWLLAKIRGNTEKYINLALEDSNPDIQIVGIRIARQSDLDLLPILQNAGVDRDIQVLREMAIALHLEKGDQAAEIWRALAATYQGEDRWFLEALGIGATNNWEAALQKYLLQYPNSVKSKAGREIIWRARTKEALPYLAEMIKNAENEGELEMYFRSFDFYQGKLKNEQLHSLLESKDYKTDILALKHLDPEQFISSQKVQEALTRSLEKAQNTEDFIYLVRKYRVKGREEELWQLATEPSLGLQVEAMKILLDKKEDISDGFLQNRIRNDLNPLVLEAMGTIGNRKALNLLSDIVMDNQLKLEGRKAAVAALGKGWTGEEYLLKCVKDPDFDPELYAIAGSVLFNVYRNNIQEEAAKYIPRPETLSGGSLPTIRNLVPAVGRIDKGKQIFGQWCQTCHIVDGQGIDFGPELSEIGDKLSREGLYRAIIFPSDGINNSYEGTLLTLKDNTTILGIMESNTEEFTEMRLMGGITTQYAKSEILSIESYSQSLMTNLTAAMSELDLIDLVEYLASLKKQQPL